MALTPPLDALRPELTARRRGTGGLIGARLELTAGQDRA